MKTTLRLVFLLLLIGGAAHAQTYAVSPILDSPLFDTNGLPLNGGFVYTLSHSGLGKGSVNSPSSHQACFESAPRDAEDLTPFSSALHLTPKCEHSIVAFISSLGCNAGPPNIPRHVSPSVIDPVHGHLARRRISQFCIESFKRPKLVVQFQPQVSIGTIRVWIGASSNHIGPMLVSLGVALTVLGDQSIKGGTFPASTGARITVCKILAHYNDGASALTATMPSGTRLSVWLDDIVSPMYNGQSGESTPGQIQGGHA